MPNAPIPTHALPPRPVSNPWDAPRNPRDRESVKLAHQRGFAPMSSRQPSPPPRNRTWGEPSSPDSPRHWSPREPRTPPPRSRSYAGYDYDYEHEVDHRPARSERYREEMSPRDPNNWESRRREPPSPEYSRRRDWSFQPSESWKRSRDDSKFVRDERTYKPSYPDLYRPRSPYSAFQSRGGYSAPRGAHRPSAMGNYKRKEREAHEYDYIQDGRDRRPRRSYSRSISSRSSSRSASSRGTSRSRRVIKDRGRSAASSGGRHRLTSDVAQMKRTQAPPRLQPRPRPRRSSTASSRSSGSGSDDVASTAKSSSRTNSPPPAEPEFDTKTTADAEQSPGGSAGSSKDKAAGRDASEEVKDEVFGLSLPTEAVPGLDDIALEEPQAKDPPHTTPSTPAILLPAESAAVPPDEPTAPSSEPQPSHTPSPRASPSKPLRIQTDLPPQNVLPINKSEAATAPPPNRLHLHQSPPKHGSAKTKPPSPPLKSSRSHRHHASRHSTDERPTTELSPRRPSDRTPKRRLPKHELIQPADGVTDALRVCIAARRQGDLESREDRVERILAANRAIVDQSHPRSSYTTDINIVNVNGKIRELSVSSHPVRLAVLKRMTDRDAELDRKNEESRADYLKAHNRWLRHCQRLDIAANPPAVQNVASDDPITPITRSTRRSAAALGDAVRSDLEMEQIIMSLGNDDLTDPNILAARNLAKIPDMLTSINRDPPILYDDTNGTVLEPQKFYDISHEIENWTEEERKIFIRKYALYPKQFGTIASFLEHKTARQCILFYYVHKKEHIDFRDAVLRWGGGRKRKGPGGRKRKGNALLADIASIRPRRRQIRGDSPVVNTGGDEEAPRPRRKPRGKNKEKNIEAAKERAAKRELIGGGVDMEAGRAARKNAASVTRVVAEESDEPSPKRHAQGVGRKPHRSKDSDVIRTTVPDMWTEAEQEQFVRKLGTHGTNFKLISASMPNKTAIQMETFYKTYKQVLGLDAIAAKADIQTSTPDPTPVVLHDANFPTKVPSRDGAPQFMSYQQWAETTKWVIGNGTSTPDPVGHVNVPVPPPPLVHSPFAITP